MSDIIGGVSIISVGEAKGHGLFVDMQTLQEVKACAESYKGGVKVNLDHGAGIKDIIGFVDNFRIVGEKLLGDLNLLETADRRNYVLEIAEKLPDTFGISISFSGPIRTEDGMDFASCTELYSADLVQTPAANPTGLFSFEAKESVDNFSEPMDDQNTPATENLEEGKKEMPSIEDMAARLAALEEALAAKNKMEESVIVIEDKKEDSKEEEMGCACGMSRFEQKLDLIIKNFGAAPMKASAPAETPKETPLDLKSVIVGKTGELGSRTAAIKFAMQNHPAEYIALRDSNQLNF
jgi:hypothetical protein